MLDQILEALRGADVTVNISISVEKLRIDSADTIKIAIENHGADGSHFGGVGVGSAKQLKIGTIDQRNTNPSAGVHVGSLPED